MTKLPYKKLILWQKSMTLTRKIYSITQELPDSEKFGLVSQMRRAAVSIPSNIAEGSQRSSHRDFCRFLEIAKGSLAELETQLLLCEDLHIIKSEFIKPLLQGADEVGRILHAFKRQLME